jgi:hypothetical protein
MLTASVADDYLMVRDLYLYIYEYITKNNSNNNSNIYIMLTASVADD